MMPGVTYLPPPSMMTASAGAVTVAPTLTIRPPCIRIAPFGIVGPAAVMIVTLRITVGRDGYGTYVLGNGSAFGTLSAPAPGAGGAGAGVVAWAATCVASNSAARGIRGRIVEGVRVGQILPKLGQLRACL